MQETVQQVASPHTVGLAFDGAGPDNRFVKPVGEEALPPFSISVSLMWLLSDGTTVPLPNRDHVPFGLDEWSSSAENITINVSSDAPLAGIVASRLGGYPVSVRLLDWSEEFTFEVYEWTPEINPLLCLAHAIGALLASLSGGGSSGAFLVRYCCVDGRDQRSS